jgi:hypothetical protein
VHLAPPFQRVLGLAAAGTLAFGFTAIASIGVAQATPLPSWSASGSGVTAAVPAGICAIEWDLTGGSGGKDSDGNFNGLAGEAYTVQPAAEGDTFTLYPGTAGADGVASTSGALGGTNGYTADPTTAGAPGGLDSGVGAGGGGAASVVEKDGSLYLLAFGGDGTGVGGGTGGGGGADQAPADDPYFDSTLTAGAPGDGVITGTGLPCAPSAPYLNYVSAGDRELSIDFTDDGSGDLPATSYEYTIDGGSTWTTLTTTPSDGRLDATIAGLTNGTLYTVSVRGVAANGAPSDPSNEETGTPMKVATAPGHVTASVGPASLTLHWTAATAGDFPIDHYEVVSTWVNPGAQSGGFEDICKTTSATALTCTGPAQAGKKHTLAVYAVDTQDNEGAPAQLTSDTVPFLAGPPTKNGDLTPASGTATSGVQPGSTMTVSGSGYDPGSTVTVLIYSSPQVLTTTVADASGKFTVTVAVPAGLEAGQHTLVASGLDPSGVIRYVTLPVTVAGSLAYTGFDVALPLTGGLIALGVGATLLVVSRRRKVAVAEPTV